MRYIIPLITLLSSCTIQHRTIEWDLWQTDKVIVFEKFEQASKLMKRFEKACVEKECSICQPQPGY